MKDKLPRPSALPATRHAQDPGSPAASPSFQDASALGEVSAPAHLVTAKERFDFVLNEQLDLYRKFQKQGAHREARKVLKDMCRTAEALAKVERAEVSPAHDLQSDKIELPELTAEQQVLQTKAKVMTSASRRSSGEMIDCLRNILRLEEQMAKNEMTTAPPESKGGGEEN